MTILSENDYYQTELDPVEKALVQAKYPGQEVELEFYCNYYRVYAGDQVVAKEIGRDDAVRQALK